MSEALESIEGVAHVEVLLGEGADPSAPPSLLVEVPHGADERAHYDALRGRLVGDLPDDLHLFFHANTDRGAWQVGLRVAQEVLRRAEGRSALLVRCLVPRTFVDTNRVADAQDQLASGGMTAGVPSYVRHEADRAHLLALHAAYVRLVDAAVARVCGAGGFALLPHTYGPRTMGIERVDDDIVHALRRAWAPEAWESWPIRPEVDLITRTPEGQGLAPAGMPEALIDAYRAIGVTAVDAATYTLHPATQGARHAARYPGQTLCLEVRRDLLTERFDLLAEWPIDEDAVAHLSGPLVEVIDAWLAARAAR